MRLEYEQTFDDQLALDRARTSFWRQVPGWIVMTLLVGLCFAVGIGGYRSGTVPGWWVLPVLSGGCVVGVVFLQRWEKRRKWRRAVGPVPPRVLVEFGDAGVFVAGGATRTFIEWRGFSHYRETKELFLLYQGQGFLRFFPKRVFGDEGVEQMRQLLAERIGRTKYVAETPAFPVVPMEGPGAAAAAHTQPPQPDLPAG
jgi:hypothetical protein